MRRYHKLYKLKKGYKRQGLHLHDIESYEIMRFILF